MPIYEFVCEDCTKLSSVFVRSVSSELAPRCEHCGSSAMKRAVSRVSLGRTEQQILEQYGVPQPGQGADAYKDPRQIGRWVEQRFDQMGMELPSEARRMIDAAREGEFPEPVKDL
jgi:putative FmdB family regulatory protein